MQIIGIFYLNKNFTLVVYQLILIWYRYHYQHISKIGTSLDNILQTMPMIDILSIGIGTGISNISTDIGIFI